MQINPFGLPSGAGAQSASAFAGTGLGFIEALGAMTQGGLVQPMAIGGPGLAQAATRDPAQPRAPLAATGTLPGFQQPAAFSQLLATAAKLPAAQPTPAAPEAVLAPAPLPAEPVTPLAAAPVPPAQPLAEAPTPETPVEAPAAPTSPAPAKNPPVVAKPLPRPDLPAPAAPGEGQPQPDAALTTDLPVVAKPEETAPTPRKAPRGAAVETDPAAQPDAKAPVPAELLATGMPLQPAPQPQPQPAPREAMQTANNAASPAVRKTAAANAPAGDATQPAAGTNAPATADFADAVAARGDSSGGDAHADAQGQPDARPAGIARADAPVPAFQPGHATAATHPAAAGSAPAPAEPVIEARSGHLGHSLGVEIARKVELGEETLRIRLNPIELGRIEVTLAFDDKGSLQATVRTESAQAMDLLRQDAPDLARTLDQAGVRTDAQSFRFENRGGDGGGQQAQQQHSQNRGSFASSDDDAGAAEPIYRPVRSDGQVDLLA
ncbi:flagellar hook-length control protein FliK [Sphingomonas naasensis]|uniref:Flagellar hook-length control protein FliK n=1 Tax=Sphingomonas naasensis TaxID=1344951 RepID=A0A4S1WLB7_9SPHN|nr:flagellar hook-length control protein FliK [Sphingomonas naasensis]NIJ20823.1 flagellar hook-length control protein FliK [Sphingomonas naasensis]TGX43225.1 flagellar hook-length control protein FliK [Sphingomonas naasensis]